MPDEIRDHDEVIVNKAIDDLRLRFDTVQIFVTRQEHGGRDANTVGGSYGYGNWYARYGQVINWVENDGSMRAPGEAEDTDIDDVDDDPEPAG